MRQLVLDLRPSPSPRFDNFVSGPNQALLAALQQQIAARDGSVLYLWGSPGSGRSHLLQAAVQACAGQRPAHYAQAAVTPVETGALLAIDDVEQLSADAQIELFRSLIGAREAGACLVLAGNAPPAALPLRPDVASRIAQGLVFEIQPLDDAARADLLGCHARERGFALDDSIVQWLLRHGQRDLPWLLAVLDALDEASLAHGRRVTLPLVREILAS
ncbi:MAG: DnaA regulatory inactivator Hda [Moraxellaceae bacterium]|nr:DnaA regulatory inactivator Hda [Moraxellaceae bacterium]